MSKNWKKDTALFLSSQTVSLFGSMLVQHAITWHITLSTQSGLMMTISIICGFLPTFFLSPFAGVWADRYNRKTLIILADSAIAASTLVLAILFTMGYEKLWLLFVISAIRALGAGVQTPAVSAFLPQFVPEDKLTRVNGINTSIMSSIMFIAPILAGGLLTMASVRYIFYIDVVTAAMAVAIMLIFLHVPPHARATGNQPISYFHDMRNGYEYIKNHDFLKAFFIFGAIFNILVAPAAFLTPLQVTRSFGPEVWRLTAIEIAFSIGMMAGGIFMASWGGLKNKVHTMILAYLIIGACTIGIGISPFFWIYLGFMVLTGMSIPLFNTPATVLLQQKVEKDYLGRVFGVMSMITSVMMPMGMLVFGPLADIVKIEWILAATGLLVFTQGLIMRGNKVLIKAGE